MDALKRGTRTRGSRALALGVIWGTLLGLGSSQTLASLPGDPPPGPPLPSPNAGLVETTPALPGEVSASLPDQLRQKADPAQRAAAIQSLGRAPMYFEPNLGQTDKQVKYLARGRGYTLFVTDTELVTVLHRSTPADDRSEPTKRHRNRLRTESVADSPHASAAFDPGAVLRMGFVGAAERPRLEGIELQPGISNYFIGNDPKKWRTQVPHYAKVRYRELYAGVDLVLYGNEAGPFEYDFVVAPGADPGAIRLSLQGAEGARVDQEGNLRLALEGGGEVTHRAPHVYQVVDGSKQAIAARYILLEPPGTSNAVAGVAVQRTGEQPDASQLVGFEVAAYRPDQPLIIDPVLEYATYLGGSGDWGDSGYGISVDSAGNAYVAGYTYSADFPTANALYPNLAGAGDAFIFKLNADGSAPMYSTYLGGSDFDVAHGIAVDSAGNAYVAGSTYSVDFPTVNALYPNLAGAGDAFIFKLNANGSVPIYSTYLGGSDADWVDGGIAVDSAGNAYVTGSTYSADFPTVNALYPNLLGTQDAFIFKLNANGSAPVYSTYLGGSDWDSGRGIAVDSAENAYVTGSTYSADFPTAKALYPDLAGAGDAFIFKLNANGSVPIYSSYLGGSYWDYGRGIAVDSAENAYVTGSTYSADFPTANALYPDLAGAGDAFIFKLNANGSVPIYSTYLGGSDADWADGGIAVDSAGNAYVTGSTSSADFPTVNALYRNYSGSWDAFVFKLNAVGSAPIYSTYLGGSDWDYGEGIAVDRVGNAYVTGKTQSADFPTVNALYPNVAGVSDAFIAKIGFDLPNVTLSLEPLSITVKRGSKLWYRAEATNTTQDRQCFNYWTNVTLPSGATYPSNAALVGPVNLCLDPGETKGAWHKHSIPRRVRLGTYGYNGFVGPYPDVWDEASFQFEIIN
ncbi:MAG: SBBP repeat-containing protein [Pseudomonadota bacterium]|nr:SBBP repeat-containing protein [Pseudomonadota bacterium]